MESDKQWIHGRTELKEKFSIYNTIQNITSVKLTKFTAYFFQATIPYLFPVHGWLMT